MPRKTDGRTSKWVVNLPAAYSKSGKRERHFFATKDLAETFCQQTKTRLENFGTQVSILSPAQSEQAVQALEKLRPFAVSLNTVVEDWIARRRAAENSVPFETLLEEFAKSGRHNRARSASYRQSIVQVRNRLASLHGHLVSELTTAQIDKALQGMKPTVRNFTIRILSCALNLAIARGYLGENPMKRIELASDVSSEIAVYTPSEVVRIMNAAEEHDPQLLPFLAISFFAGVRRSELVRMDWGHVELEERYIRLPKNITKTQQGRHIPLEENLASWLLLNRQETGSILPFTSHVLRTRERLLRQKHGVPTIKHGARHCYGSYWLALHENIDRLMLSMGHTDFETTREHYAKAVTRKAAELYWSILPPSRSVGKIIPILATA